jgi:hypothetical protein
MLPADLLNDLREIAAERDWSVSETVRRGVRGLVNKIKPKKMSAVDMLWKMTKKPYGGDVPKDLSTNDEYLYGKLAPDYKGEK